MMGQLHFSFRMKSVADESKFVFEYTHKSKFSYWHFICLRVGQLLLPAYWQYYFGVSPL